MAVREDGKEAVTHYRLRERFRAHTALECRLETGRTHQIRAHGARAPSDHRRPAVWRRAEAAQGRQRRALRGFKRQALHAETLEFTHPITGEPVRNTAPVPEDMLHLLKVLREDSEAFAARERTAGDGGRAAVAAGRLAGARRRPCADHAPARRASRRRRSRSSTGNRHAADGDTPANVEHNRQLLQQGLALPSAPHWLRQVHSSTVLRFDAPPVPGASEPVADAAVTSVPGVVLAILTADCLPVVFAAADGSEVGAAHAGWRGWPTACWRPRWPPCRRRCAWLGPAAGPSDYEIGEEVYHAFVGHDPAAERAFVVTRPGHWKVDLFGAAAPAVCGDGPGTGVWRHGVDDGRPGPVFASARSSHRAHGDPGLDRALTPPLFARAGPAFATLAGPVQALHAAPLPRRYAGQACIVRGGTGWCRCWLRWRGCHRTVTRCPPRWRSTATGRASSGRGGSGAGQWCRGCGRTTGICASSWARCASSSRCGPATVVLTGRCAGSGRSLLPLPTRWFGGVRCREAWQGERYTFLRCDAALGRSPDPL